MDGASETEDTKVNSEPPPRKPVTLRSILIRTVAATTMTGIYLLLLQAGHLYCILCGVVTQFELYRELVNVRYVKAKEKKMPWFRTLQWLWFVVAMMHVYGDTLHDFCKTHRQKDDFWFLLTEKMSNSCFYLYCIVFVASVLTLRAGLVRFQISQYMWSIVTIVLVVFQCKFFATNTLNGLFWFFFPMATVVMNDVSAYFCGITMGRKFIRAPFIALSPNKTWEGFLGAAVLTVIFSFFFPALLSRWDWFTCPQPLITTNPFPPPLHCHDDPVKLGFFSPHNYRVHVPVLDMFWNLRLYPIQLHGLAYGLFASLVAPFGGFFASAIKRAYNLKDFDSIVPGHGGMMDRMDCQLLMMGFTSFHYRSFIAPQMGIGSAEIFSAFCAFAGKNRTAATRLLLAMQARLGEEEGLLAVSAVSMAGSDQAPGGL